MAWLGAGGAASVITSYSIHYTKLYDKDLVAFFDTEHRFLAVNGEYARYLQVDENAIVGRHASEVIGLERYSKFLQHQKP